MLPTAIVPSAELDARSPARVRSEFIERIEAGLALRAVGRAADDPRALLRRYAPRYRFDGFGTAFYVSGPLQNPDLRFCIAWIVQPDARGRERATARLLYKDISLVWRAASHVIIEDGGFWIGKGDVRTAVMDGYELLHSAEETTDLPYEVQNALETVNQAQARVRTDHRAVALVLQNAPPDRIAPYRDFYGPRRAAAATRANLVNRGRDVAWFDDASDPRSLCFAAGYAPDFDCLVEHSEMHSSFYGGRVRRYRFLSENRKIQWLFMAAPRHVWIVPPQALTTELSSFGVRTVDVMHDDALCVPGYEFHYYEYDDTTDEDVLVSQIPAGFVGRPHPRDETRCDASAWIERIPIVREFRRRVLRSRKRYAGDNR